jgi:poly(3-hydroxybutyrate) depolymerase
MKKIALCVAGLAAGVGLAAATQYPVLETLGFLPDEEKIVAAGEDVANDTDETLPSVVAEPEFDSVSKSPSVASQKNADVSEAAAVATAKDTPPNEKDSQREADSSEIATHKLLAHGMIESQGKALGYRLLKPEKVVAGKRYPLVVFLHGAGERGSDNRSHLKHGGSELSEWVAQKERNAFVLFPQCPQDDQWADHDWNQVSHQMKAQPTKSMRAVLTLIDDMIGSEPIDHQRIYAAGLSMGGYGVFDLLARRPNLFAAGAALCGGTDCNPRCLQRFKNVPLYIVHGDADKVVDVENSRNVVAGLRKLGGSPEYLELSGVNHDCWTQTFDDDKLFSWMFSQNRGAPSPKVAVVSKTEKAGDKPEKEVAKSPMGSRPLKSLGNLSAKGRMIENPSVRAADRARAVKQPAAKGRKVVSNDRKPIGKVAAKAKKKNDVSTATIDGKWNVVEAAHHGRVLLASKLSRMDVEVNGNMLLVQQGKKAERGIISIGQQRALGDRIVREIEIRSTQKNAKPIVGFYFFQDEELNMVWSAPGGKTAKSLRADDLADSRVLKLKQ